MVEGALMGPVCNRNTSGTRRPLCQRCTRPLGVDLCNGHDCTRNCRGSDGGRPTDRAAYLHVACGNDRRLLDEVQALLDAGLAATAAEESAAWTEGENTDPPGHVCDSL